ncbi:hypothetical protein [Desulfosudis oleivorans]|uniref:hypothetical protein n=1 Tax=Desulfosudis oleivorans TaxID=181663 RepID=UPI00129473F0|nr:hypothetical protein [Desulfosudis oleivorans]
MAGNNTAVHTGSATAQKTPEVKACLQNTDAITRKKKKASLTITDNKYLVQLFKTFDRSSLLHEIGHIFLNKLQQRVQESRWFCLVSLRVEQGGLKRLYVPSEEGIASSLRLLVMTGGDYFWLFLFRISRTFLIAARASESRDSRAAALESSCDAEGVILGLSGCEGFCGVSEFMIKSCLIHTPLVKTFLPALWPEGEPVVLSCVIAGGAGEFCVFAEEIASSLCSSQ